MNSSSNCPVPISVATLFLTASVLAVSACSSSSDDDSNGLRLTTVAFDPDNDGMTDDVVTWIYDSEGRATAEEFDTGADGSVEIRFGRVLDEGTLRIERDNGVNGTIDGVSIVTVDADGLIETVTRAASDDGVAAESIAYSAEGGRIVLAEIDLGDDGTVDYTARYRYDTDGRIAGADFDNDGDEVTDDALIVVREANGTVVRLEEDFGNDGGVDRVRILTYAAGPCADGDIANVASPIIVLCL